MSPAPTPTGNTEVTPQKIREHTERLYHTPMAMSLIEWGEVGSDLLGAATRIETLERELAATHEAGVMHAEESLGYQAQAERLAGALAPFAEFERCRDKKGNSPKSGSLYGVSTETGFAEITVEDFEAAERELAAWKEARP